MSQSPKAGPNEQHLRECLERFMGYYATEWYLPCSGWSRERKRRRLLRMDGQASYLQAVKLPAASWKSVLKPASIRLTGTAKKNGNVRLSELGILAQAARQCPPDSCIFEIGTFDGRTTLNMLLNAHPSVKIHTLDLPADHTTAFAIEAGERQFVDKPLPGSRCLDYLARHPDMQGRIHQWLGDSATFNYSGHEGNCSLVFVDGSHAYDYAKADTETAMRLVRPGGVVIWHDYGIWPGVTEFLESCHLNNGMNLLHLRGTSLVFFRQPWD